MLRKLNLLAVLALAVLASCDIFYGVTRHTPAPPDFDARAAAAAVREHPDHAAAEGLAWDGEAMWSVVRRGEAHAGVGYSRGGSLSVESWWVGRPPAQSTLRESLRLQSELIELLRARCPGLPPEAVWATYWGRMAPPDDSMAGLERFADGE
ncbi:MAG: hypothetical protein AB7O97_18145 [Planctomycetota bacterium]